MSDFHYPIHIWALRASRNGFIYKPPKRLRFFNKIRVQWGPWADLVGIVRFCWRFFCLVSSWWGWVGYGVLWSKRMAISNLSATPPPPHQEKTKIYLEEGGNWGCVLFLGSFRMSFGAWSGRWFTQEIWLVLLGSDTQLSSAFNTKDCQELAQWLCTKDIVNEQTTMQPLNFKFFLKKRFCKISPNFDMKNIWFPPKWRIFHGKND